ncbi:MAG: DUF4062 domain-containing protein [Candidatus Sedimenticola sp. (ex Thyasira tokunagai)]
MASTRKIIRAFLASPGDLQVERKAIRDVVDEINESWANEFGYHVELIGWEDTVSRFGRAQHVINQDLGRCDLFLGMIWKKWGTPPDNDGEFSSGFEEEFERSIVRREETGSPEISLFFKEIPALLMEDKGEDLKKVLAFRDKIIAEKKILFQNFLTVQKIEKVARKCISAYVIRVKAEDETSEPDEQQAKRARTSSGDVGEGNEERGSSPLSAEGFGFLENLIERIRQPDSLDALSASDVARFRLLANSISRPGNEKMNIGAHDINILFKARTEGAELGDREIRSLTHFGFRHLADENVPLWCWYSALADSQLNLAVVSSVAGVSENEKVGAISVIAALDLDIPTEITRTNLINRDLLMDVWFSDDSSTRVRTTALGYLAKCGTAGDLEIVRKEYDRSDHGTSRSALECMVRILLRTGQTQEAQELVLESQFETFNIDLLRSVLSGFDGMETSALLLGLGHRNSQIRLRAMKSLHARDALDIGMADRLTGDSYALVRSEAVRALLKLGKPLAEDEIKKILVSPQNQHTFGLLGLARTAASDKTGEELFRQYQMDALKDLSESELKEMIDESLPHDDAAYFAFVERYFRKHVDQLRRDVDDRFSAYFEERIRRLEVKFGGLSGTHDLISKTRKLGELVRKELTRRGLSVLCAAKKPEDLHRIRANLCDGYAGASRHDADYLTRHGEWSDISILTNAEGPTLGATLITMSGDEEYQAKVAKAITSIGKKYSISDLLSLEMPAAILKKTIELCSESRFAKISKETLLELLNHESDGVRKAAAVMAVRAFTVNRIRAILREYVLSDNYRYYNVVHWLDLGASMRRDDAKKVARAVDS